MSKKFTAAPIDRLFQTRRRYLFVAGSVLLGMVLFIGLAAMKSRPGFPLDDAWIHQTYARNLIRNGRWEYIPGVTSAGSTAPLWTLLLALGYLFRLPYLLWAYWLGGLCLLWLAVAGTRLWRCLWPDWADKDWLAGLVLAFTWPLVWAAASGMETLLFAAIGLSILGEYASRRVGEYASRQVASGQSPISSLQSPATLGILSGLLILTRPDGLVLLLLVALGLVLGPGSHWGRVKRVGVFLGAAVVPLLPYFAFNLWVSGHIWPNTFYAKQIEYAAWLAQPLLSRLARLLFFSLGGPPTGWRGISGAHLLLLPGLVTAVWRALKTDWAERRLYRLLPLLWAGGHVFLYAWRLPVTYQHGRYLFAAIPIWVLYGLAGWRTLLAGCGPGNHVTRSRSAQSRKSVSTDGRAAWLGQRVAALTFAMLMLLFLLFGAQAYANDVAFIEGEMVTVAHWLAQNTPPDALIAAHDIGAIGYFAERPLLDLAGLISPEIIPSLADESALARRILAGNADYLVTAPGWPYADVAATETAVLVYTTNFAWTQENQSNNMTVYQLNRR